jgi:HSP90 family molecular chaperone
MSQMLESFQQNGIDGLFLIELINKCYGQQPKKYSDHKLLYITKENCEIAETDEEKKGFGTSRHSSSQSAIRSSTSLARAVRKALPPRRSS